MEKVWLLLWNFAWLCGAEEEKRDFIITIKKSNIFYFLPRRAKNKVCGSLPKKIENI